ncbi:PH domain-containing protein [Gordonia sp. NPDC003504]
MNKQISAESAGVYPVPSAWLGRSWRLSLFGYLLAGAAVLLGWAAVHTLAGGHPLTAAAAASGSAGVALWAWSWRRTGRRQRSGRIAVAGVRTHRYALCLGVDPAALCCDIASALGMGAAGVLAFVAVWRGDLDMSWMQDSPRHPTAYTFLAVGVVGAAEGLLVIRRGTSAVTVSPDGVDVGALAGRRRFLPWGEVVAVRAVPTSASRREGARMTTTADKDATAIRAREIRLDPLHLGASGAFWLIDFYARHPELRDELGDTRATRRLRTGSVVEDAGRHVR